MRRALLATAAMNIVAAIGFLPPAAAVRVAAGLPAGENPVYLATVALFVGLFGVGYLWSGATGRGEPIFIGIAAAGKISFVALLVGFWLAGALPARAPVAASPDLAFGVLFLRWLRSAI
jgi:hypothetical protein